MPLPPAGAPVLRWHDGALYALCHDGALKVLQFEFGADISSAADFHRCFGERALALRPSME
jgi:hypothetical protein